MAGINIVSGSLPNISHSFAKARHPAALQIHGKCTFPDQDIPKGELFWSKKDLWKHGEFGPRAATARGDFGLTRASWAAGSIGSESNIRAQTAMARLSVDLWPRQNYNVDEIILLIKEKLHTNLHNVRQMFRANDPKGEGKVSKEALTRILWNLCGFLTSQQINSILSRLGLISHSKFSFDDFAACFEVKKTVQNEWLTPTTPKQIEDVENKQRQGNQKYKGKEEKSIRKIWDFVKAKVNQSDFSLEKYLPASCLGPSGIISRAQLKKCVDDMGFAINDDDFDSLWARLNKNNADAIKTDFLCKLLRIPCQGVNETAGKSVMERNGRKLSVRNLTFDDIVNLLKEKLNESAVSVLNAFAKHDKERTGYISRVAFRQVLTQFSIPMGAVDLEHLLARFNLRSKDGMVAYERLLEKLQSRSTLSLLNHTIESLNQSDRVEAGMSSEGLTAPEAEARLLEVCHGPFLRLLAAFRKIDAAEDGFVNLQQFKEVIEKAFLISLMEEHLQSATNMIGDPATNLISYTKFFALFQNRPLTSELKEEVERSASLMHVKFLPARMRYRESFKGDWARYSHAQKIRSLQQLRAIVHNLLQKRFRSFCKVYINVCQNDACTADKEKMDVIFQRMNIILLPMELEKFWYSLPISYPTEAISLRKFIRYFSKLKKVTDPGPQEDNPATLIQIKLKSDVIKQWKQIKTILKASDPSGSKKVPLRVIYAMFLTLKFNIQPAEIETLCQAFDLDIDGHFHYIQFLKYYVTKDKKK
ncbi:uncharacterized protein LOC114660741 [Erpetoichthys calabaricus]|uniref:uncharacterized protein LOC114660741 n=1 Tax=Erpetoichthys calabaricus TaxID=27687 RepID=UPI002233FD45|nr:uncharacterized protein LOC114660741 [Erpetoichthys calabaricus]